MCKYICIFCKQANGEEYSFMYLHILLVISQELKLTRPTLLVFNLNINMSG